MSVDKNPEKIKTVFNEIAQYYDLMNNVISFGTHNIIKFLAIRKLNIKPRTLGLDICCGSGDFVGIISKFYPRSKIIGLDFSKNMLQKAKQKFPKCVFIQADATQLPFKNDEFDFITMGFGLRNIENRALALSEIHRVLNQNGKFLHLDFGQHNFFSKIFDLIVTLSTKFDKKFVKNYKYLIESKKDFPPPNILIKEIELKGFKCEKNIDYLFGIISAQVFINK